MAGYGALPPFTGTRCKAPLPPKRAGTMGRSGRLSVKRRNQWRLMIPYARYGLEPRIQVTPRIVHLTPAPPRSLTSQAVRPPAGFQAASKAMVLPKHLIVPFLL